MLGTQCSLNCYHHLRKDACPSPSLSSIYFFPSLSCLFCIPFLSPFLPLLILLFLLGISLHRCSLSCTGLEALENRACVSGFCSLLSLTSTGPRWWIHLYTPENDLHLNPSGDYLLWELPTLLCRHPV